MKIAGWHVGTGQRQNPFLQIPLHHQYHVGNFGVDYGVGVITREEQFGTQLSLLNWVDEELDYPMSIWEMAVLYAEAHGRHRPPARAERRD